MIALSTIRAFLDDYLQLAAIPDEPQAHNGLQLEAADLARANVTTIACGVDAAETTIDQAITAKAELLLVHHGLLWGGNRPLVGVHARKLAHCFAHGLSIYAAHLPLDVHSEVGNNIGLVRALGLAAAGPFGRYQSIEIGLTAACDLSPDELCARIEAGVGACRRLGAGPARIRHLAVITGSAGSYVGAAATAGLDALIVGEAPHHAALEAQERGIHLILAGHYRTEVFGVRALGTKLEQQFGVRSVFVGSDSGL